MLARPGYLRSHICRPCLGKLSPRWLLQSTFSVLSLHLRSWSCQRKLLIPICFANTSSELFFSPLFTFVRFHSLFPQMQVWIFTNLLKLPYPVPTPHCQQMMTEVFRSDRCSLSVAFQPLSYLNTHPPFLLAVSRQDAPSSAWNLSPLSLHLANSLLTFEGISHGPYSK